MTYDLKKKQRACHINIQNTLLHMPIQTVNSFFRELASLHMQLCP